MSRNSRFDNIGMFILIGNYDIGNNRFIPFTKESEENIDIAKEVEDFMGSNDFDKVYVIKTIPNGNTVEYVYIRQEIVCESKSSVFYYDPHSHSYS